MIEVSMLKVHMRGTHCERVRKQNIKYQHHQTLNLLFFVAVVAAAADDEDHPYVGPAPLVYLVFHMTSYPKWQNTYLTITSKLLFPHISLLFII